MAELLQQLVTERVERLPQNGNGKIDRRALRERFQRT
jgi:acyl-coenzyme A synthetase/AMP-(fatty) acid ligase